MSDPTPILQFLGLGDAPEEPAAPLAPEEQDAAPLDPTAAAAEDEGAEQSLAEAMAALDGQDAPTEDSESATEDAAPAIALTPDEIAALMAENEAFKAERAQQAAQNEEHEWHAMWDSHMDQWEDRYDQYRAIVRDYGIRQGFSEREIRGLISEVVDDGIGIDNINQLTPGVLSVLPGTLGYKEWLRTTTENRRIQTDEWRSSKTQPSALDQMVSKYSLTPEQRTSLAKFIKYPPDHFEEIARTLGANNQRVSATLTEATKHAARNVAQNLSRGITPGTPGAAAPAKPYRFRHTPDVKRQETEFIANRILGWRSAG
jgi:hypothetical protein